jgi:hypothetical protein
MTEFLKAVEDDNSFRLQNRKIHLTYKSHIPPEAWLSWLVKVKQTEVKFYSIVHEKGENNYEHTHILLDFGYQFQTRKAKFFDWKAENGEMIHPNIKIVKTATHWTRTVLYHYKESPPFTNIPKPNENPIKEVWKHNTLTDALISTCSTLNNVGGVIAAFNCKPADYGIEPVVEWRDWQKEIIEEIKSRPDPRRVVWIYDPSGNAGKSFLTKHLGQYRGAFVSTKANTYHVATALDEFISKNGQDSVLVVIFNFTRQQENHKIYQALEELKDGMMTAEKYKGKTMFFPNPHLICMANYIPDITSMSPDRWDIRALQYDTVVKRYENEKITFEHPNIDPYIKHCLIPLDIAFAEKQRNKTIIPDIRSPNAPPLPQAQMQPQIQAQMQPQIQASNQNYEIDISTNNIRLLSPVVSKAPIGIRPLNINTGTGNLAALGTAAALPISATRNLAPLGQAAEPHRIGLPHLQSKNLPPLIKK